MVKLLISIFFVFYSSLFSQESQKGALVKPEQIDVTKGEDRPVQIINNYYGVSPDFAAKKNEPSNSSFSFNLGGSEILGIEYGYFASKNFEISLGLGILFFPFESSSEDELDMAVLPLVNLKFTYYMNLNENNKFFIGALGTYVIAPGAYFGYEFISDGGFFLKVTGTYSLLIITEADFYYPIPGIAIGSKF